MAASPNNRRASPHYALCITPPPPTLTCPSAFPPSFPHATAVHMLDRYRCQRAAAAIAAAAAAAAAGDAAADEAAAAWAAGGGGGGGGGGWSGKGSFLYHVELVADVLMHGVTLAHYMHVWFLHGLSFHVSELRGAGGGAGRGMRGGLCRRFKVVEAVKGCGGGWRWSPLEVVGVRGGWLGAGREEGRRRVVYNNERVLHGNMVGRGVAPLQGL